MPLITRWYTLFTMASSTLPWWECPHQMTTSVSFSTSSVRPCSGWFKVAVRTFPKRSVSLKNPAMALCMPSLYGPMAFSLSFQTVTLIFLTIDNTSMHIL
jgi:hypothetical protein